MSLIVRLVLAAIVVGVPAAWFSTTATEVSAQTGMVTPVRGPLAEINDNDRDELCRSGNPRKQKKCKYNGWDVIDNDNGSVVLATDSNSQVPTQAAVDTVDGLTLELSRSAQPPVINAPFVLSLKGEGASIERVWWWTHGPVQSGPFVDDLALVGEQSYSCGGAQPCSWSWPVVVRYLGSYSVHARVRDTSGREVEVAWNFDSIEQPNR